MSAIFSWRIHTWNFKTQACTVQQLCYESKIITDDAQTDGHTHACTHECPRSNMPFQFLRSWRHNNFTSGICNKGFKSLAPFFAWRSYCLQTDMSANVAKWNYCHFPKLASFLGGRLIISLSLSDKRKSVSECIEYISVPQCIALDEHYSDNHLSYFFSLKQMLWILIL